MNQKYKKLFNKIAELNIIKPFYCEYIIDNLFDNDTLKYNKHANKTWDYDSINDNLNIISNYNKKPVFYYICSSSSSESESDYYSDSDSDEDINAEENYDINYYINQNVNPYTLFNPYIDIDIYNKDNTVFLFIFKLLFDMFYDYSISDYLNTNEIKQLRYLLTDMFFVMKLRKRYSYEIEDYYENIMIIFKNNELVNHQYYIIKDALNRNTKTNFYDLIDNYNKIEYDIED